MKKVVNNQDVTDNSRAQTRHRWHDAVPDDRLAHLIREATRLLVRSLQARLRSHDRDSQVACHFVDRQFVQIPQYQYVAK